MSRPPRSRGIAPRISAVSRPWIEELYFSVEPHPRSAIGAACPAPAPIAGVVLWGSARVARPVVGLAALPDDRFSGDDDDHGGGAFTFAGYFWVWKIEDFVGERCLTLSLAADLL